MPDKNGYNESLFTTENGVCFLCNRDFGYGNTARHEVFYGISNRDIAKKEGLWVYLCPDCHAKCHHKEPEDLELKEEGQMLWENVNGGDRKRFIELFGKSVL